MGLLSAIGYSEDEPEELKNSAFVFIKPHANTDKTRDLVRKTFEERNIDVVSEGELTAQEIDDGQLIDQHYYSIASKATILKPSELNVPAEKFKEKFGLGWQEALDQGVVFNAADACEELQVDSAKLNSMWGEAKKSGKMIKFGGGFYCGELPRADGSVIYAFNGFFMSMRAKFVAEGTSIYYFVVEFDQNKLSWAEFRGDVLGPTDPATAPADSLRGLIASNWKDLGLTSAPNVGDNGVHASASPFEGLAERTNWLGTSIGEDPFGRRLLQSGISKSAIEEWSKDPQVKYGPVAKTSSLFDALEDTDADECLARCQMVWLGPRYGQSYVPEASATNFTLIATGALIGFFAARYVQESQ